MKTLLHAYQDMASALRPLSGVWRSTPDAVGCVLNKSVTHPQIILGFLSLLWMGMWSTLPIGTKRTLALGGVIQAGDPRLRPYWRTAFFARWAFQKMALRFEFRKMWKTGVRDSTVAGRT